MNRYPWGLLWPLLFALACFAFSLSYALHYPQAALPAFLVFLALGCLGLFTSLALASLHRRIATLESRLGEIAAAS